MTTIGIIGCGKIGGTLAGLAADAGHHTILSNSRGPGSLRELAAQLGDRARAATPEEAARDGDLVVVSVPLKAYRQVPAADLRGRVVISTVNHNPGRDGAFPGIEAGETTAAGVLQAHLPESPVVQAFSNIFFKHLATLGRPAGAPGRCALPIAGDDAAAKARVAALLDTLGYDAYDAGALGESRRFAPGTPGGNAYLDPEGMFAAPGRPLSAAALAELLA
ncbi:NADP oxidoreductase [Actinoplanes sp. NBRC 14428]|nr:NADP oxidoreductase [Actinoplanes sp. NBRC 14428]